MSFNPNKRFSSGASSVTVQYSVDNGCQGNVSFGSNDSFIHLDNVTSGVKISIDVNTGTSRTGSVYMNFNGRRCEDKTITITQAAGPCTTAQVSYRYNNYSGSVRACDTSAEVTVSGVKTTTYNDPSCEGETEQVTTSVTLNFDKNTSSNEKTIQSSFTINNSNFTVYLVQPGECVEPCVPSDITFTPNPNQEFNVDGCYTSATITLSGTSVSSYTNCESTTEITTKNVVVNYDKNESSVASDQTVTVSDVPITLNRTACGSPEPEYENQYFTIESLENQNNIIFRTTNTSLTRTISVSTDNGTTWTEKTSSTDITSIGVLNKGEKILIKGNNEYYGYNVDYNRFYSTKPFIVYGNIMSLVNGDSFSDITQLPNIRTFQNLFGGAEFLTSAKNLVLPATTLQVNCYSEMFYNCTSLTEAPVLPATTLGAYCYDKMFYNCTSLTEAPVLPATTLGAYCYYGMFQNCSGLTTAPQLSATVLADGCYQSMFHSCTNLTTPPELPATTLKPYCYQYMFQNCTSLTEAPVLPATVLADGCYKCMFRSCTSLTTAPKLQVTTLTNSCYNQMFYGCTSLKTPPELPATTLKDNCYEYMFQNCTSLTEAPELPARTMEEYCYRSMFNGCTGLTVAPDLPATVLAESCYRGMFQDCKSLTTAPDLPATELSYMCYIYMFYRCESLKYIKCLATEIDSDLDCTTDWVSGVANNGRFVKSSRLTEEAWGRGSSGIPTGWDVENAS